MGSQRFCLRWNNHQSNLLSVFDQLLHDQSFVDVTLAVEGKLLGAHKMVLSACSPYFQALFVDHPDKHPIVILKDVPYSDMRSLLDFMYRGEVSVDQDRLTAFLKVAESLRIKGLTEVNEERCDLPSIANSLLNQTPPVAQSPQQQQQPQAQPQQQQQQHQPPPNLHRIQLHQTKRPLPNPMLNSALTAPPKRKRGRPRKLSGSCPGTPNPPPVTDIENDETKHNNIEHQSGGGVVAQGNSTVATVEAPIKEGQSPVSTKIEDKEEPVEMIAPAQTAPPPPSDTSESIVKMEPIPSTSTQDSPHSFQNTNTHDGEMFLSSGCDGGMRMGAGSDPLVLGPSDMDSDSESLVVESADTDNNNDSGEGEEKPVLTGEFSEPPPRPAPVKRRIRRRAASGSDPAEALTEMSVRGLNLFRYASVTEGVYKCMECAKADILKTFKNKYSFQRHAFLYHEGQQRKVFPCPVCSKEFSRPDKMKNHMKTVHDCFMPKECLFPVGFYLPP